MSDYDIITKCSHFFRESEGLRRGHGTPDDFLRDCYGAVCDRKLKLGVSDAPFKLDIVKLDSFSGQVRSLTYDVISKPPHCKTMSQICNAANARQSASRRRNFQKITSPEGSCFVHLVFFRADHLGSGQSRDRQRMIKGTMVAAMSSHESIDMQRDLLSPIHDLRDLT